MAWDGKSLWIAGSYGIFLEYERLYDVSKFYQGEGLVYVQTNTAEVLNIKSSPYSPTITLNPGDLINIALKTTVSNEILLKILSNGEVVKYSCNEEQEYLLARYSKGSGSVTGNYVGADLP